MTSYEFVNWLRGFVAASNNWNLTPKAWEELKNQLSKVEENSTIINSKNNEKVY